MRFWHWFELDPGLGETGAVEIRAGNGEWTRLSTYTGSTSGGWTQPRLDLKPYAGKEVSFAFHLWSAGSWRGWFLDEVQVETGDCTFRNPEDFELGWGCWYTDHGTWEVGTPKDGPFGGAHSGTNCAGTLMEGKPAAGVDTRLISPPVTVPDANWNPRLRFRHWFELDPGLAETGVVEIRVGIGEWTRLSTYTGTTGGRWAPPPRLDLKPYAGKEVSIAFHFAGAGSWRGWFVDDVLIETDSDPPFIAQPPSDLVVTQGQAAAFIVLAGGSAPLNYQWQFGGLPLTNGSRVTGADNNALFINPALRSDEGTYTLVVSNSAGTATTNASLTVHIPAFITTQPRSQTVLLGSTATFTVGADGEPPLSYQWRFNDDPLPGKVGPSLVLSSVQLANEGDYSVVVTNLVVTNIACSVTSSIARLKVLLLPSPWTDQDVGEDVAKEGSAFYADGIFTVTGSGEDIEGTADMFHFVQQPWIGDGQIVARVRSLQGGDARTEAGVMFRENLTSGSPHVLLAVNAALEAVLRRRLLTDPNSVENAHAGTGYAWLRLMRMGNTFAGHVSTNGVDWEYVWHTTLDLPGRLEVGLAVTAHNNLSTNVATARFDNVSLGGLTPLPGTWPEPQPRIWLGGEPGAYPPMSQFGGFKMLIGGSVGEVYLVLAAEAVPQKPDIWLRLGTVTNQWGVVDFVAPQPLPMPNRFYELLRVGP